MRQKAREKYWKEEALKEPYKEKVRAKKKEKRKERQEKEEKSTNITNIIWLHIIN